METHHFKELVFGNIDGVQILEKKTIPDDRGFIKHFIKATDPEFNKFGEVYFSYIYPGVIKGWHLHKRMELNYVCILGNIKLVLFDMRETSKTKNLFQEVYLGELKHILVKIPPGVLNGYMALGNKPALIANLATEPHDPSEMTRIDPWSKEIGYNWKVKDR